MVSRYFLFSILMCGALICIFFACKDQGAEPTSQGKRLSADSTSLHITKGYSRQVILSGGVQPYSITAQPNALIATASLSSALLTVSAVDTGSTSVTVSDGSTPSPDTVRIAIGVFSTTPVPTVHYSTQVQPIFNSQCTGCHGSSGGLSLSSGSSYASLVNVQALSYCTTMKRVLPGSADNSVLYLKIAGTICGSRMPQGGSLGASDIALIQTWINEGAHNN